jgi:CRP/FNR family cyclic AMP-dependent transcriptional regulator
MTRQHAAEMSASISRIDAFRDLPPRAVARLDAACKWRRYEPGEVIVAHLDASDDVFFLASGQARVSVYSVLGKAIDFCDLGPGAMFGEVAAIDGQPRSAAVEARTTCTISSMTASTFRDIARTEPTVSDALLRYFASKIRELTTRVYEFSALPVNSRIQAELMRLAKMAPRSGQSAKISALPTHAEIASRTSTHREAVTRELSRLSHIGLIEQQGRSLLIKDLERLSELVHEATGE